MSSGSARSSPAPAEKNDAPAEITKENSPEPVKTEKTPERAKSSRSSSLSSTGRGVYTRGEGEETGHVPKSRDPSPKRKTNDYPDADESLEVKHFLGTVHIRNLSRTVTQDHIQEIFAEYGDIICIFGILKNNCFKK